MLKQLKKDKLLCEIFETRGEMGKAAANDIHDKIIELLSEKDVINMIFAAAPSQNEEPPLRHHHAEKADTVKHRALSRIVNLDRDFPLRRGGAYAFYQGSFCAVAVDVGGMAF